MLFCTVLIAFYIFSCEFASCTITTPGVVYRRNITQNDQTVIVGALFPLHRNGAIEPCESLRTTVFQLVESMVLAVRTINDDPTLLPNVTLIFDIRDTCESVNYALQQSVGFIRDIAGVCRADQSTLGASGVLGAALSSISQAVSNLFGLFQIPQISYASTASLLSDQSVFEYFFRTTPPDNFQASALADIVTHFNWNYIIVLHSDDLYGRDGSETFIRALKLRNTTTRCIPFRISLSNDPPNYEEAVDMMSQDWVRNASVVLLFGHNVNAVGMLRVIRDKVAADNNFPLQNITWIASDSWADTLTDEYRSMARGMLSVIPQSDVIQEFDDYFTSLNPLNNLENPWFLEFWETEFNCSFSNSSDRDNCDPDNQIVSPNTTGYSQFSQVPLVFDAVYAIAHSIQDMIDDRCPSGALCSEILNDGIINGELLRQYISNVSFSTTSQKIVSFDANGDVLGKYSILNLQTVLNDQYVFEIVGTWNRELSLTGDIEWVDGSITPPESICSQPCMVNQFFRPVPNQEECCFTCVNCTDNTISKVDRCVPCMLGTRPNQNRTTCVLFPVTFLTWSDPWAIFLIVVTCIGLVATTFVIVVFVVYFKNALIKASSRELSAILLAGIFLCYLLPFFFIATPSSAICAIRRFGVGFCFAVSFSALLVKTNRIHRIFNRRSLSPGTKIRFINPLSQIIITFIFIGVQVLIATIWLAVEPPSTKIEPQLDRRELECAENPYIGFSVFLAYNLFLLVVSTYFAFRTRKVPGNFNETKFINVTLYTVCIIWLAFIPVYFATVNLGTLFQTVSLVLGIILSASTTLCCLFISKVIILFTHIQEEKQTTIHKTKKSEETHATFNTKAETMHI